MTSVAFASFTENVSCSHWQVFRTQPVFLCTDLCFLVQHQTFIQMGQSPVHCFTDSLARGIGLPGLSVRHALIAVRLDSCLNRHEPSRCQLYPSTAAPHRHCLLNYTQTIKSLTINNPWQLTIKGWHSFRGHKSSLSKPKQSSWKPMRFYWIALLDYL